MLGARTIYTLTQTTTFLSTVNYSKNLEKFAHFHNWFFSSEHPPCLCYCGP